MLHPRYCPKNLFGCFILGKKTEFNLTVLGKNGNVEITVTEKAKNFLVENGWDANYGARPLKRTIQKYVEDVLAEELLNMTLTAGDSVELDYDDLKEEMVVAHTNPIVAELAANNVQ